VKLALALLLAADFVHLYRQALEERIRALGPQHPKVAQSARDLGRYLLGRGERAAAEPYLRQALAIDEKALGPEHEQVAADLEALAGATGQVSLLDRAIAIRERAGSPEELAAVLIKVAGAREGAAAAALYRRALIIQEKQFGPSDARLGATLNNLAQVMEEQDPGQADALYRRALAIQEKTLGPGHPETGTTLNNRGNLLASTGRLAEAEPLLRRALAVLEAALGDHPRTAAAAGNLGRLAWANGALGEAERHLRRALEIDEKAYGPSHPEAAADRENLAALLEERRQSRAK
jgi:Tfp pilus assembly protein PilF